MARSPRAEHPRPASRRIAGAVEDARPHRRGRGRRRSPRSRVAAVVRSIPELYRPLRNPLVGLSAKLLGGDSTRGAGSFTGSPPLDVQAVAASPSGFACTYRPAPSRRGERARGVDPRQSAAQFDGRLRSHGGVEKEKTRPPRDRVGDSSRACRTHSVQGSRERARMPRRLGEDMGEKRLVVRNGYGDWEVRIPGAHKPVRQHGSLEDAE